MTHWSGINCCRPDVLDRIFCQAAGRSIYCSQGGDPAQCRGRNYPWTRGAAPAWSAGKGSTGTVHQDGADHLFRSGKDPGTVPAHGKGAVEGLGWRRVAGNSGPVPAGTGLYVKRTLSAIYRRFNGKAKGGKMSSQTLRWHTQPQQRCGVSHVSGNWGHWSWLVPTAAELWGKWLR